jgi:hypothetical protein
MACRRPGESTIAAGRVSAVAIMRTAVVDKAPRR